MVRNLLTTIRIMIVTNHDAEFEEYVKLTEELLDDSNELRDFLTTSSSLVQRTSDNKWTQLDKYFVLLNKLIGQRFASLIPVRIEDKPV
jgi:hypothetical protein